MNIKNIKEELFKLLSLEKTCVYSSKDLEKRANHNAKYDVYNYYYMLISDNVSYSYIFDMKKDVLEKVDELEKKYNELLDKYKKEESHEVKNKLAREINSYAFKIEAYNTVFNIINKHLRTNDSNSVNISNQTIDLIKKIKKESDIEKKYHLEESLFRLNEERRLSLCEQTDSYVIKEICELESLELRIAESYSAQPTYTSNKKEFLTALKETIQAINEYYFLDYKKSKNYKENPQRSKEDNDLMFKKRLDLYTNKFYSLITSLFNTNYYMIEKGESKISTDDLINYLSIYNLDGNYEIFRSKNKNILIGNKEINKFDYQEKVNYLKGMINTLIEKCANKIKNGTVEIVDKKSDKKELLELRNFKLAEIDSIIEGEIVNARK